MLRCPHKNNLSTGLQKLSLTSGHDDDDDHYFKKKTLFGNKVYLYLFENKAVSLGGSEQ